MDQSSHSSLNLNESDIRIWMALKDLKLAINRKMSESNMSDYVVRMNLKITEDSIDTSGEVINRLQFQDLSDVDPQILNLYMNDAD